MKEEQSGSNSNNTQREVVVEEEEDSGSNSSNAQYELSYKVGVAENKNFKFRKTMEDVHTYVDNFNNRLDWGYFAIFDGHAGNQASKWCGANLHNLIEQKIRQGETQNSSLREEGEEEEEEGDAKKEDIEKGGDRDIRDILNQSFVEADKHVCENLTGHSGCTAAVCVITWEMPVVTPQRSIEEDDDGDAEDLPSGDLAHKRMLYTANVGDTRIVVMRDGKAIRLTYDHKASDLHEMQRVESAGGLIMKSRVNGMLAVTRSIGDKFFDKLVISNPFTTSVELTSRDQFLIIACDGLWDVVEDQEACDLILANVLDSDPVKAAEFLVDFAMKKGTTDNITVMVIFFSTFEEE